MISETEFAKRVRDCFTELRSQCDYCSLVKHFGRLLFLPCPASVLTTAAAAGHGGSALAAPRPRSSIASPCDMTKPIPSFSTSPSAGGSSSYHALPLTLTECSLPTPCRRSSVTHSLLGTAAPDVHRFPKHFKGSVGLHELRTLVCARYPAEAERYIVESPRFCGNWPSFLEARASLRLLPYTGAHTLGYPCLASLLLPVDEEGVRPRLFSIASGERSEDVLLCDALVATAMAHHYTKTGVLALHVCLIAGDVSRRHKSREAATRQMVGAELPILVKLLTGPLEAGEVPLLVGELGSLLPRVAPVYGQLTLAQRQYCVEQTLSFLTGSSTEVHVFFQSLGLAERNFITQLETSLL